MGLPGGKSGPAVRCPRPEHRLALELQGSCCGEEAGMVLGARGQVTRHRGNKPGRSVPAAAMQKSCREADEDMTTWLSQCQGPEQAETVSGWEVG